MGQFLGHSDEHASNIGLISNQETGKKSLMMMSLYLLLSMTYWDNVKQQWEHMLFDIDRRKTGESKALSTSVQKVPISSSETHSNSGRVTFENNEPIHCSSQPSPSVSSSPQEKSARNNGVGGNNTSDSNSDSDDEVSNSSL